MLLNCGIGKDPWESLDNKEIKSVNPKGNQSWIFIWRTDAAAHGVTELDLTERLNWTELTYNIISLRWCCCSVSKSCATLCDPMDGSMPGFPILHYLQEFAQPHVHWVSDCYLTISSSAAPLSPLALNFSAIGSFPMSQFFTSGGQSIEVSASASVLPMNIQGWLL